MIFRVGWDGNPAVYVLDQDARYLATFVCIGFFFISLVQIISTLLGDKAPIHVRISYNCFFLKLNIWYIKIIFNQDILFALCGFFFFLGFGAKSAADIVSADGILMIPSAASKGLASMSIITSVVYLVDLIFGIINLKNV